MILAGTEYKTRELIKALGTVHFNSSFNDFFEYELPAGLSFKISVWANPTDDQFQVWLKNPEIIESLVVKKEYLQSANYNSFSFNLPKQTILDSCEFETNFGDVIYFYSQNQAFSEFSNFAPFGFEMEGVYYKTVEHYYQSQKFSDPDFVGQILNAPSPKSASILGKSSKFELRQNWDQIKDTIMFHGVKRKFETNELLLKMLLKTEDKLIIENSPYDNYWGIGSNGTGFNKLGAILMRVREVLR